MKEQDKNISTEHQRSGDAAKPSDTLDRGQDERGERASVDRGTGEVHGAGSGAGGGGNRGEDYDSDPMSGAGAEPAGGPAVARHRDNRQWEDE